MPNILVPADKFEEEVPETLRAFYKQKEDGSWRYDAGDYRDDTALKSAHERSKSERNDARQRLADLQGRIDGVDLDLAKRLIEENTKTQSKKAAAEGDLEKAVEARVKAMREKHEVEGKERDDRIASLGKRLEKAVLVNGITAEAVAAGAKPECLKFIVGDARARFRLEDDEYIPYSEDGEVIYGADGSTKQTFKDFVAELKKTAPSLFGANTGGGATPSRQPGGAAADNTKVRGLERMKLAQTA